MSFQAILIGAGPIGIETAAVFSRAGINYLHLEAGQIGQTITRWPRNTRFFSSPEWIAIAGMPIQSEDQAIITGEAYLAYLRQIVETRRLKINTYEEVTSVTGSLGTFTVTSRCLDGSEQTYQAERIVLATGDMNRPRLLGVPGEELPHVTHYWSDPHDYFQRRLLIVGGANSAVEAAIRCWRAGAQVAISYRGQALEERKLISRLYLEIDLLIKNGQVALYASTEVERIEPGAVMLRPTAGAVSTSASSLQRVDTDFVYLATGFEMDQRLYAELGVETEGEESRPVFDPRSMETNVAGVHVVGTATGGNQRGYKVFITTCHHHALAVASAIEPGVGLDSGWVGNIASRDYPLSSKDVE